MKSLEQRIEELEREVDKLKKAAEPAPITYPYSPYKSPTSWPWDGWSNDPSYGGVRLL